MVRFTGGLQNESFKLKGVMGEAGVISGKNGGRNWMGFEGELDGDNDKVDSEVGEK